jgi:hypothetical protein
MAILYEPLRNDKKLYDVIKEKQAKRVLLFFWHGLGDLVMFLEPYRALRDLLPDVHFDLGIVKGIGQEEVVPEAIGFTTDKDLDKLDYDIVSKIHFPMSEGQEEFTKGEWCCIHELGIPPRSGHTIHDCPIKNRLVCVHYNITCLPASCNPDQDTAKKVWDEIVGAGMIPIECHFEHVFHNPVNKKFDFVTATVRGCRPRVSTLAGLIARSEAFIGVVSGNFHVALSILPPDRIMLLEKDFTAPMFTKLPVARCSIKPYKDGSVSSWLTRLQ